MDYGLSVMWFVCKIIEKETFSFQLVLTLSNLKLFYNTSFIELDFIGSHESVQIACAKS